LGKKLDISSFSTNGTTGLRREEPCTTKLALRVGRAQREPKKDVSIQGGQK
jgi:hypothetical protein